MGTKGPEGLKGEEPAFKKLAKDLGSETAPKAILENLEVLASGLRDRQVADKGVVEFLRAGGLPPLIRHLRGAAAPHTIPDPDVPPSSISATAALAFSLLLRSEMRILPELKVTKGILLPLIDALRDAPCLSGRSTAAWGLGLLAKAQPKQCKAIAKAGVFDLLFVLYKETGEGAWASTYGRQAGVLASELFCSRMAGARALEREIRAPGTVPAFSALVIIQDCLLDREDDVLGIVVDAGVVKAMVATLEHESPFCIAAAAGALALVMQTAGSRGPALIEASDAIPALVRIIKRPPFPGDPKLFSGALFKTARRGGRDPIRYNDPAALAIAGLLGVVRSNRMLDSFLMAGGVPAIVHLLGQTTCPVTLQLLLDLITLLVSHAAWPRHPDRTCELADELHLAGIVEAALQALKTHFKTMGGKVLQVLFGFFTAISDKYDRAATALLVRANGVELTVKYLAENPVDELGNGLGMLLVIAEGPEGRQRLGQQKLVFPLIKGITKGLREARGEKLLFVSRLVSAVFENSPGFLPAAIEANLTPDLIRLMREVCRTPPSTSDPLETSLSLNCILGCLRALLMCDTGTGTHKSAVDAGIVPAVLEMLELREEQIMEGIFGVVHLLVLGAPGNEFPQWGAALPRAIARLLSTRPPLQPVLVADTLFNLGTMHPDMMLRYSSWGIDDSLKRLMRHSDPNTANAARRLMFLVNEGQTLSQQSLLGMVARGVMPQQYSSTRQPPTPSASTSSPSPNPRQDRRTSSPLPQRAPYPTAADILTPIQRTPSGPRESTAGSHAKGDEGGLSGAPQPRPSPEGTRGVGASPGRRAAQSWVCARCEVTAESLQSGKLKECSGCRSVRYCGRECQTAHWPVHKATCKRLQSKRG